MEASVKLLFFGIFLVIVSLIGFGSFYTIDQGNRGIVLRFGKLTDVADPGIHLKTPLIDSVKEMTVRTQKVKVDIDIYSKDVQGATVALSVNYALDPSKIDSIYTVGGTDYEARLVTPQIMAKPKDIFGKYNAVNIIQAREKLTAEIKEELDTHFKDTGIIIQSVQLENIDFSDAYEHSVEERMKAEVEVQRVKQNLERERINADMIRTKAQGEADAKLAQATADAKSIEIKGKAEAEAISAKAEAMKKNPDYIRMLEAERWDGKLPQTMLPNMSLPIIK